MRMFFGIILGIVLTVGAAYVADSIRSERPVVNWDVVNDGIKVLSSTVQGGWARLTGHAKDN
jgi:hypothetical protein